MPTQQGFRRVPAHEKAHLVRFLPCHHREITKEELNLQHNLALGDRNTWREPSFLTLPCLRSGPRVCFRGVFDDMVDMSEPDQETYQAGAKTWETGIRRLLEAGSFADPVLEGRYGRSLRAGLLRPSQDKIGLRSQDLMLSNGRLKVFPPWHAWLWVGHQGL